jgi:hypothetical protein
VRYQPDYRGKDGAIFDTGIADRGNCDKQSCSADEGGAHPPWKCDSRDMELFEHNSLYGYCDKVRMITRKPNR